MNDIEDFLSKPVDLKSLLKKIDLVDEAVEDAALEQPKFFLTAARYRVQRMRDRVENELAYSSEVAKIGSKYRERKDEKGKRTLTEGAVAAKVQLNDKIHKLRRKMELSLVYEKFSELLVETFRKRESAIKIIIDARFAEAGTVFKKVQEQGVRKAARKMGEEIRQRAKRLPRSSDDA
jgi:hypothetical protein